MPNTLVIVESPAKCKKIETYLGPGYKVMASFGHLRTLLGLKSIDIEHEFNPTYSVIQEELKLKQIEKIRSEINNSDEVIIATDDDREGESIGWHICELFGLSVTNTKRIIFHEITETAIQSAISHPKRLNINIIHAQQSRQILDLLVGYTISPILWNGVSKTHVSSLSAGRCQTPALRLVYENYLDIKNSPGKIVYNTTGLFTNLNLNFELNTQFTTGEEVRNFLKKCKDWKFLCNVTSPKKVIKKQPEPLTTSKLQQLASNDLHMSPKITMKCAQQLYEAGYITYMRTDSSKYSNEFIDSVKQYIVNAYGEKYISQNINNLIVGRNNPEDNDAPLNTKKTVAQLKGIPAPQEAHEAIRPVNINIRSVSVQDSTNLLANSIKLYELIWKRTLETCMPSAQYNSVSAKITAPDNTEFIYKTEQPIFIGWQIVDNIKDVKQVTNDTNYQYITTLKQNIEMNPKNISSKFTMNELKPHYTEAKLVQLLEDNGIGRPSTFASLVDKIQERKYVENQNITGKEIECIDFVLNVNSISEVTSKREFGNEKNKLVIQPLGIIVIEFLLSNFDAFFNYDYTKLMEDSLDLIAKDKLNWVSLCDTCFKQLTNITNELQDLKKFSIKIDDIHTLIIGKYGPVIKCINPTDPKKTTFLNVKKDFDLKEIKQHPNLSLEDVIDNTNLNKDAIGQYKGIDLFVKKGKYGIYAQWGKETRSLKGDFESIPIEKIEYIDIIRFLDKDTILDASKPVGFVRELNSNISIRTGKYGDYIFYKKPHAKTPKFLKLNGFNSEYKKCDKILILNWIKQTYNVE